MSLLFRIVRKIRKKIGSPHILVRYYPPFEWTGADCAVVRAFMAGHSGIKLRRLVDDAIICAREDLKSDEYCKGMIAMRDYFYSHIGQEPEKILENVGSSRDSGDWSTLPSDFIRDSIDD